MINLRGEREMRPGQPFQFTWVTARQHRWIQARLLDSGEESKNYLVPMSSTVIQYQPFLDATALFKEFARLDPHLDAIKQFANDYGLLGVTPGQVVPVDADDEFTVRSGVSYSVGGKQRSLVFDAELESFWVEQISEMRRWVSLWEATRSESPRALSEFIQWTDKESVLVKCDHYQEWITTSIHHPDLQLRLRYGDLIQPAFYQLQRVINEKLAQHQSTPQLLWEKGKLLHFIRPKHLLAAMWLQFALAIDGDRQYRICRGCDRWFEIGGGAKRSDSETCHPTCRKRRERKEARARKKAKPGKRRKPARRPA